MIPAAKLKILEFKTVPENPDHKEVKLN